MDLVRKEGKVKNTRRRMLEMFEFVSDTKRVIFMFVCFTTAYLRGAFVRERGFSRQHSKIYVLMIESDRNLSA